MVKQQVGQIRTAFVVELARVGGGRGGHHATTRKKAASITTAQPAFPSISFETAVLLLLRLCQKGSFAKQAVVFEGRLVPPIMSYVKRCFQAQALPRRRENSSTNVLQQSRSLNSLAGSRKGVATVAAASSGGDDVLFLDVLAEACTYALVGLCTDPKCAAQLVTEGVLPLVAHMCSLCSPKPRHRMGKKIPARMPKLPPVTQLDLLRLRDQWNFHCMLLSRELVSIDIFSAVGTTGAAQAGPDHVAPKEDFTGLEWAVGGPESTHFAGLYGIICLVLSVQHDSAEWTQVVTDGGCLNVLMLQCYDTKWSSWTPPPATMHTPDDEALTPSWTPLTERLLVVTCLDKFRDKDLERYQLLRAHKEKMLNAMTDLPKYIAIGDIEGINAVLNSMLDAEAGKERDWLDADVAHMCAHVTTDLVVRNEFLKKIDFLENRGKGHGTFPAISTREQVKWLSRQLSGKPEVVEDAIQSVDVSGRNAVSVQNLRQALSVLQLHLTAREAGGLFEVLHTCSPKSSSGYSSFFLLNHLVQAVETAVLKFSRELELDGSETEDDVSSTLRDVIFSRDQSWQAEVSSQKNCCRCTRCDLEESDLSTLSCVLRYIARNRLRVLKAFAEKDPSNGGSISATDFCKCMQEQRTTFGPEDIRKISRSIMRDPSAPIYYLELVHRLRMPSGGGSATALASRNAGGAGSHMLHFDSRKNTVPGTPAWNKVKFCLSVEVKGWASAHG
jgi:hypothetical protein